MGNRASVNFPAFLKNVAHPLLHLVAGSIDFYALWYDQKYVNVQFAEGLNGYPFKSRVVMLTMWNLALQTLYMGVAFLNDIIGSNEASPAKMPAIRYIKDVLFSTAYPSAMYVSSAFWTIFFLRKDLIFPERLQKAYPNWLNHVLHTLVAVFMNIEMITANITYPSDKIATFISYSYMYLYGIWVFIVYYQTGSWIYPILGYLNWPARILLVLTSFTISHYINIFALKLNKSLSVRKFKSK